MSLPVLIKLPDSLIEESQYFTTVTQNPNRSTTGVASYTNPRTLATYSVASGGQEALVLYMYETNPALKNYIFSDTVYAEIKSNIETSQTDITNLETDVNIINTAVSDTGLVNAMVVNTAGTFDMAKNGNVTPFIIPLFTNTGTATLSIDGGAVTGIRKPNDAGTLVVLEAGDIKKNVPTQFVLDTISGFFIFAPKGGSNIKSIQKGNTSINNGTLTANIAITSVDLTKSIILISRVGNGYPPNSSCLGIKFNSATQIQVYRTASTQAVSFSWQVIEFNNVKLLQKGQYSMTTATANVTLTSVNLTKTFLVASWSSQYATDSVFGSELEYRLTTSTNLYFNVATAASSNFRLIDYFVIEFN